MNHQWSESSSESCYSFLKFTLYIFFSLLFKEKVVKFNIYVIDIYHSWRFYFLFFYGKVCDLAFDVEYSFDVNVSLDVIWAVSGGPYHCLSVSLRSKFYLKSYKDVILVECYVHTKKGYIIFWLENICVSTMEEEE